MVEDGPTSLTSFGMITEPPAPEQCIDDALVNNNGAEGLKPHLPLVEVCMLSSTAGGLPPAGTASTAMRAILPSTVFFLEPRWRD